MVNGVWRWIGVDGRALVKHAHSRVKRGNRRGQLNKEIVCGREVEGVLEGEKEMCANFRHDIIELGSSTPWAMRCLSAEKIMILL